MFGSIIHRYTRTDALADGVLIDVSDDARECGYRLPVAITAAAWTDAIAWIQGEHIGQNEAGRLRDVLAAARIAIIRNRGFGGLRQATFPLARIPDGATAYARRVIHLQVVAGPDDDGRCVLTIGLPGEG